jgi:Putative binding domain, N-terminal/Viral BACON domain
VPRSVPVPEIKVGRKGPCRLAVSYRPEVFRACPVRCLAQRSHHRRLAWSLVAPIAALSVIGCQSSSTMSTGPSPTKCEVTLSTASVAASGGSGTVTVATAQECGWSASSQVSWISALSPTSGQGNGQVQFSVAPNPQRAERQGEIVVNDARVQIRQEAATCQFTITSTNQDFANGGGTGTVTVTGILGCPWTARSNTTWITIMSPTSGDGSGAVEFRVAPNSQAARTGTLTIADHQFTVRQSAGEVPAPTPTPTPTPTPAPTPTPPPPPTPTPPPPAPTPTPTPPEPPAPPPPLVCNYTVNSQPHSFPFGGGSGASVAVSSPNGCFWTAQSNASWITITSGASSSGTGAATFSVAPNSGLARTGTLTVASTTITVTQARDPSTCRYTLNPNSASLGYVGGTVSMSVSTDSDCSWTSTATGPWITITSGESGAGNGSVEFRVAQNSGLARSGTVTVGSTTISVSQSRDPSTCRYSLNPNGASLSHVGGTVSMSVSTDSDCSWTSTANGSFITITSGASGTGTGSVGFRVAPNSGLARSGTVTVGFTTVSVTQARDPSTCRYSINPGGASIGSGGGGGSISVSTESDCAWVAGATAPWLVITSGGSGGMGSGSISWSAGENKGSPRMAEVLVMGHSFEVTQGGV